MKEYYILIVIVALVFIFLSNNFGIDKDRTEEIRQVIMEVCGEKK